MFCIIMFCVVTFLVVLTVLMYPSAYKRALYLLIVMF